MQTVRGWCLSLVFYALLGVSRAHFVRHRVRTIHFTVYVDGSVAEKDTNDADILQAVKYAQKVYTRSGIDVNMHVSGIFRDRVGAFPLQCDTTIPKRDTDHTGGIHSDEQGRLQIDVLELLRASRRKKECLQRLGLLRDPSILLVISSDTGYPVYGASEQNGFQKGKAVIICFISPAETVRGLAATLAHELGHVLGAEHDAEQNSCRLGYIMEGSGAARKSRLLSSCSIESINKTLAVTSSRQSRSLLPPDGAVE